MASKRWASREDAEAYLRGDETGQGLFERVTAVIEGCGGAELRVAPTQITWARHRGFAAVWTPGRWRGRSGSQWYLSIYLPRRDSGAGWAEVSQVRAGLWVHHLLAPSPGVVDDRIEELLAQAHDAAGPRSAERG